MAARGDRSRPPPTRPPEKPETRVEDLPGPEGEESPRGRDVDPKHQSQEHNEGRGRKRRICGSAKSGTTFHDRSCTPHEEMQRRKPVWRTDENYANQIAGGVKEPSLLVARYGKTSPVELLPSEP